MEYTHALKYKSCFNPGVRIISNDVKMTENRGTCCGASSVRYSVCVRKIDYVQPRPRHETTRPKRGTKKLLFASRNGEGFNCCQFFVIVFSGPHLSYSAFVAPFFFIKHAVRESVCFI